MLRIWLAVLAAAAALTSCSGAADHRAASSSRATSSEASGRHNANDAAFLRLEVAHHDQAVAMADIALRKTHNARLRSLARQIKLVQSAELTVMRQQLRSWHAETDNHGHTHLPPGNLTDDEMASLAAVRGLEFDRYWSQMMTLHEMATNELASVELEQGIHPKTRALARTLDAAQDRLTNRLLNLLKTFPK